jgi:hypothetical protein
MQLTSALFASPIRFAMTMAYGFISITIGSVGAAQDLHPYRTPSSIALATSLQRPIPPSADQQPVLEWIAQCKAAFSVPVVLDRRLPSDRVIAISDKVRTLDEAIQEIAIQMHAEVAVLEGTIVIVPPGYAARLESTYWLLASSDIPRKWLRQEKDVIAWEQGAHSRDVLQQFLVRYPIRGLQIDSIEHDVWGAASWEQTTPLVVAITLLSGFDLRPVPAESDVAVSPIDLNALPEVFDWEYGDEITRLGKERWLAWRSRWSDVEVKRLERNGKTFWAIRAPATAHRELVQPLAPPPKITAPSDRSTSRFTGRFRGELQAILTNLAKQRQLELELSDLPSKTLRKEMDVAFEQATFEELLNQIGSESGLTIRSDGKRLKVTVP